MALNDYGKGNSNKIRAGRYSAGFSALWGGLYQDMALAISKPAKNQIAASAAAGL
jgi:hypothetical protein